MSDTPKGDAAIRWAVATDYNAQCDIEAAVTAMRDLATEGSPERARWGRALRTVVAAQETLRMGCPVPGHGGERIALDPMADRLAILADAYRGK